MRRALFSAARGRMLFLCSLAIFATLHGTASAQASHLSEFDAARRAYENQDYAKAARGFESLVGGVVPRATDEVVRLESRKYLGATYLFLGKKTKAREQFRLLLEEDESYTINPLSFPNEVVRTFTEIRAKVRTEKTAQREEKARREEERNKKDLDQLLREQQRIRRLEELAASETVEQVNSRWLAMLPFGVGQFRNGHRGFGIALAVTQSVLLVGSIVTFVSHNSLRDETPTPSQLGEAQNDERLLRIGNWASSGALVAAYAIGAIDAQVRFKPVIRKVRKRDLPPDVPPAIEPLAGTVPPNRRDGVRRTTPVPSFDLQIGLTGVTARLKF